MAAFTCVGLSRAQASSLPIWHCRHCLSGAPEDLVNTAPSSQRNVAPDEWASSLASLKKDVPILQRIPKSVRGILAEKLAAKIDAAVNHSSQTAWWDLLTFSYSFLRAPVKSTTQQQMTQASHIRTLIAADAAPPL